MESSGGLLYSNLRVLVVPYPSQGHINPMLQFAKRLASKNLQVTFVTTEENRERMLRAQDAVTGASNKSVNLQFETISDGLQLDFNRSKDRQMRFDMLSRMGGLTLANLIERLNATGSNICCIVYDALLSWVPEIAKKFNIPLAFFWTQSCAVYSIYYHFNRGQDRLFVLEMVISPVRRPAIKACGSAVNAAPKPPRQIKTGRNISHHSSG